MTAADLSTIPAEVRAEVHRWRALLEPLFSASNGITSGIRAIADATGIPYKTVERKYYLAKKKGWLALIDRRACGPTMWNVSDDVSLTAQDIETFKRFCEQNQRKSLPAVRLFRQQWRAGLIETSTPLNPTTGFPRGWSERNLMRHIPSRFELQAARIGRSAAANERRLVYTTRANLWVGSHYLFDDMWHDHFVNVLTSRTTGRPLEFHALDLFSANKFAWGMRVRTPNAAGTMEGLKEADMRFLLAQVLGNNGYSQRGTVLVVEHGTAAVREDIARLLHDETGGLITVARSGMEGAAAAAHQYAGRSKGNFRFKAALESLGNLIHNEMGFLPGQTGKDRDHRPEQLHGLLKHNDALLIAMAQLPPERIEMLAWPILTIQQFQMVASEIYQRINARTTHDLEGWDMHHVPDQRTGLMRKLSPAEVWRPGARQLTKLRPEALALLLLADNGIERTTRKGMFELRDAEISGDLLRFDAAFLSDREKYLTVLNPYQPDALFAFDAKGRFVAACPRIHSICRADVEAVQRECGAAAKVEAQRLQPFRARHLAEARDRAAASRHNTAVVSGDPVTPEELDRASEIKTFVRREGSDALDDMMDEPTPSALDPQPSALSDSLVDELLS